MPVLAALTFAASASLPAAYAEAEAVWRPFYQQALGRSAIVSVLGPPDEETASPEAGGGLELFWRNRPGFPGGVSVWLGPDGVCEDATFYVAPVGSVWTNASKRAASKARTPVLLDIVPARYGKPDEDLEGTGRRIGIRRLIYEDGGSATRSVTFFGLPYARGLHYLRISHERP